jgi:parvulin-like peptidyl-prolyl isomerase
MKAMNRFSRVLVLPVVLGLCSVSSYAQVITEVAGVGEFAPAKKLYATVNGKPITVEQYNSLRGTIMKKRFYHGKVPDGQEDPLRTEITDILVERELVVQEADKTGLKADAQVLAQVIADAEQRFSSRENWAKDREEALAELTRVVGRQNVIDQFGVNVREAVQTPTAAEAQAYYEKHGDLFVEPESLRLATILIPVDPSAGDEALFTGAKLSKEIYERLLAGADFAEEAKQNSGDRKTAAKGGDMGYAHRGMLPEELHKEIDKLAIGETSKPLKGLEGASIFKVLDRVPAKRKEFAEVERRATDLLKRENQEQAWKDTIARLRGAAKIDLLMPATPAAAVK